jgi:hypothetical protein
MRKGYIAKRGHMKRKKKRKKFIKRKYASGRGGIYF